MSGQQAWVSLFFSLIPLWLCSAERVNGSALPHECQGCVGFEPRPPWSYLDTWTTTSHCILGRVGKKNIVISNLRETVVTVLPPSCDSYNRRAISDACCKGKLLWSHWSLTLNGEPSFSDTHTQISDENGLLPLLLIVKSNEEVGIIWCSCWVF